MQDLAITRRPPRSPSAVRVLGCGAYFKNRVCLVDGARVLWSPVHGDLDDVKACTAFDLSVQQLLAQASGPVHAVAHDLHPDFYSTRFALRFAGERGIPAVSVQHHHAHVATALAEHAFVGPVIGLALDGIGLGDDGQAWGGEMLLIDGRGPQHQCRRLDHLVPLVMPGADVAAREPWRLAAAVLHALGRADEIGPRFSAVVGEQATRIVATMLQHKLQCPLSSSAGRWFDAAAGALGLCTQQRFEADAAMALETCASEWLQLHPEFECPWSSLDLHPLVGELFAMAAQGRLAQARGAAMFHLALANALARHAVLQARRHAVSTVVLAGGCFANRILRQALTSVLAAEGLRVLSPDRAGCGDAGLALGQAWVAGQGLADPGHRAVEPAAVVQARTLAEH